MRTFRCSPYFIEPAVEPETHDFIVSHFPHSFHNFVRISQSGIQRCRADHTAFSVSDRQLLRCKRAKNPRICEHFTEIIAACSVRFNGDAGQTGFLLDHAFEGLIIRRNDSRNRRPDDRSKRRRNLLRDLRQLPDQQFISAENRVHVAQSGAEKSRRFLMPARFIEAADITGAAARIADDGDAAELIEHAAGSGIIGRQGREMRQQPAHGVAPFPYSNSNPLLKV